MSQWTRYGMKKIIKFKNRKILKLIKTIHASLNNDHNKFNDKDIIKILE